VNKLWKAGSNSSFLSLRILARGGARNSPLQPSASFLELPALEPPGSDSAGLSHIREQGAREKCAGPNGVVHTPCTVFPQGLKRGEREHFLNFFEETADFFSVQA